MPVSDFIGGDSSLEVLLLCLFHIDDGWVEICELFWFKTIKTFENVYCNMSVAYFSSTVPIFTYVMREYIVTSLPWIYGNLSIIAFICQTDAYFPFDHSCGH